MEVLSDGVKIGLGALISAVVTFVTLRANRKKERAQRRSELLEAVAQQVGNVEKAGLIYWQTLNGCLKDKLTKLRSEALSETLRADLVAYWQEQLQSSPEYSEENDMYKSAQATLLLLGEVKCVGLFKTYEESMWCYSIDDVVDKNLTKPDLKQSRELTKEKRREFWDELSDIYKKL